MQPAKPYGLMAMDPGLMLDDLSSLMEQAVTQKIELICLPPLMIGHAKKAAGEQGIRLATMIGYPFGFSAIESKLAEMLLAIVDGADELYICANITAIRNNDWQYIAKELGTLMPIARNKQKKIFIVTELSWLQPEDIIRCADILGAAGVDGIIINTGLFAGQLDREKLTSYRKHLADAVPLFEICQDTVKTSAISHTGADGFFVKNEISLGKGNAPLQGGMVFDQQHQN